MEEADGCTGKLFPLNSNISGSSPDQGFVAFIFGGAVNIVGHCSTSATTWVTCRGKNK